MKYDTEAIDAVVARLERAELPRMMWIKSDDFVVSYEKETASYPCQFCGRKIERSLKYANRKFTCLDCKRERQRAYDNSPTRIAKRKANRK